MNLFYVLLKNSNFFEKDFYNILHISAQFHLTKKNTKINLKIGTKSSD